MPIDIIVKNYSGDERQILDVIIDKLWLRKVKAGIPVVIGVVGKSSHGKSAFVLYVQQKIYESLGLNYADYVEENVLIRPADYAPKMRKVLYEQELKPVMTLHIDEAKFLLNADSWQSFKNRATRTITSTCRTVKPMIFFILAQKRKDIDAKTRDSLDYYIDVVRKPGEKPTVEIFEIYESNTQFSKPEMERRPITISIQTPDGESETIMPLLHPVMPNKDIWDKYKKVEEPSKTTEILRILEEMDKDAKQISGQTDEKLLEFVEYLKNNPAEIEKLGEFKRNQWKLKKNQVKRFGYTPSQIKEIEDRLMDSLQDFEEKGEKKDAKVETELLHSTK